MVEKFYLRNLVATDPPTAGEKSTVLPVDTLNINPATGTEETRSLRKQIGISQTSIVKTAENINAARDGYHARFTSEALRAGTYGSGSWIIALAVHENNQRSNCFLNASIYFWRPGTSSVVGFVYDSHTNIGAEWLGVETGLVNTITGSDVTIQDDDVLVIEIWRHESHDLLGTHIQNLHFDGATEPLDLVATSDAASYIEPPADIFEVAFTATKTHTTDSLLKLVTELTHDTDSRLVIGVTLTHTTDSVLGERDPGISVTHNTDSVLKKLDNEISHTTDSVLNVVLTVTHTTDSLLVTGVAVTHDTDSVLKKIDNELIHTTDSIVYATQTETHDTDSVLKAIDNLVTHDTDSVLKALDKLVTHTTDSALREIDNEISHDTDSILKAIQSLTHTTDSHIVLLTIQTRIHTTDSILKKLDNIVSHTTDSLLTNIRGKRVIVDLCVDENSTEELCVDAESEVDLCA